MTPAENFLSRLAWSKRTGPGRWIFRCPAHKDRHASGTMSEKQDGTILIRCHAECENANVVEAVGLTLADLYPPRSLTADFKRPEPRPVHAEDALKALEHEATVLMVYASDWELGTPPNQDGIERIGLAAQRIASTVSLATGRSIANDEERRRIIHEARLRPEEERDLEELSK